MKILEFRKLTTDDLCDRSFGNWSRCYEYAYALNALKQFAAVKLNPSVHNTCSGSGGIHLDFAGAIEKLSNDVVHSDFRDYKTEFELYNKNFKFAQYNLLSKSDQNYDFVLCISTLEDLYVFHDEPDVIKGFNNLLDQVKPGGKLLITCDYPTVSITFLEKLLGQPIADPGAKTIVSGLTSSYFHEGFPDYNIILIEIEK